MPLCSHGKAIEAASRDALASPETGLRPVVRHGCGPRQLKALRRATVGRRAAVARHPLQLPHVLPLIAGERTEYTMLQKSFLVIDIGIGLATNAQAQDAAIQPTVEVTASRVAETVDASLADVSVITRADIDASAAPDLIDLLRLQAGVDVARTGGAGEQTSVFLRGSNSNHVLVLIDGVRVASANTGAFAFENLPLDAVEHIEIVRGPRASYWGSDAIGGVIQIFTRKFDAAHLAVSGGSYRSADGSAGIGDWSD